MRASGSSEFLVHGSDALLCDDDAQLSASIARLVDDAALRSTLARASDSLERYDWNVVLGDHETAYREAMRRATSAVAVVATSL